MREGSHTIGHNALRLCIFFEYRISIAIFDTMKRCEGRRSTIVSYPYTQDKKWQIKKTSTSFIVYCNGQLVKILSFQYFDCGELVSRLNFGWIEFLVRSNDNRVTAHIMPVELPGTAYIQLCNFFQFTINRESQETRQPNWGGGIGVILEGAKWFKNIGPFLKILQSHYQKRTCCTQNKHFHNIYTKILTISPALDGKISL